MNQDITLNILAPFKEKLTVSFDNQEQPNEKKITLFFKEKQVVLNQAELSGRDCLKALKKESLPFLVMRKNGQLVDLSTSFKEDSEVEFLDASNKEGLEVLRHTTAHVLAYAITNLYPQVDLTIGPVIAGGYFYDIDNLSLKEENFPTLEKEMEKLIKEKYSNERLEVSKAEALERFKDNPYKVEIIKELPEGEIITCYKMGEFIDLCRGPHIPHIGMIKAFKVERLAGAYWRGKSENKMLTRVYGTSFDHPKKLKEYLKLLEEQKANDHNKLGRELGFFTTNEYVGQGLPLLTPRGAQLKKTLERWVEEEETKRGYEFTLTPYMAKSDLYKISGHWQHYQKEMFVMENEKQETLALRPMTCPFHFSLYNTQKRSYRDLPIRYAENSVLFRNEASGEMHGLIRVRQFTLADGHIMCTEEQVAEEFKGCLELIEYYLKTLQLDNYHFRLSKWDPTNFKKYIDNPPAWEKTEKQMKAILDDLKLEYEEVVGEAAFYGPKLDIQMKNVYGKEDTIMTVQIDFALPERFDMKYTDSNDKERRPLVIHRGSLGCYERTMALLIEKHKGKLPFWLAPEQVEILSISEKVHGYAKEIKKALLEKQIRVKLNLKPESLKKKVRESQKGRIPCSVALGEKEKEEKTLSLRLLDGRVVNDLSLERALELFGEANDKKLNTVEI